MRSNTEPVFLFSFFFLTFLLLQAILSQGWTLYLFALVILSLYLLARLMKSLAIYEVKLSYQVKNWKIVFILSENILCLKYIWRSWNSQESSYIMAKTKQLINCRWFIVLQQRLSFTSLCCTTYESNKVIDSCKMPIFINLIKVKNISSVCLI